MAERSAMSRKWRAGVLHAGRAAAFLTIVTGVNSVLSAMYPRYEPIYAYLVAVIVVAWTTSALLGITAAVAAAILYDWIFSPVRIVPSMSRAIPLTTGVAIAIATRAARMPPRERPVLAPLPVEPPQLPPAPAETIVDDTRVRELEGQIALLRQKLAEAQARAGDEERARAEQRVAAESREAQLANEIEGLRQQIVEHTGRFALVRREADALTQRLTESEARLADETARASRETNLRDELASGGYVADGYVTTPNSLNNTSSPPIWSCS